MKFSKPVATTLVAAGMAVALPMASLATTRLPAEHTQGSITYMSGGVGKDEAKAMRAERSKFPLSMEFVKRAKPRDEFLAGVNVTIKDPSGKTELNAVADGPIMLARLPDGKYTVSAEHAGQTRTREVVIAAHKPAHVVMEW